MKKKKILLKLIAAILSGVMTTTIIPAEVYALDWSWLPWVNKSEVVDSPELELSEEEISSSTIVEQEDVISCSEELAETLEEQGKSIPKELLESFEKENLYSRLTSEDKEKLSDYLSVSKANLTKLGEKLPNISQLTTILLKAQELSLNLDSVFELVDKYKAEECINIEKKLSYMTEYLGANNSEIQNYTIQIIKGAKFNDLFGAFVLSRVTNKDCSGYYKKSGISGLGKTGIQYSGEEKSNYYYLQLQYQISSEGVDYALKVLDCTPSELCNLMKSWQEENKIYSLNSDISTYDVTTPDIPQGFNKYQIPDSSNYRDNLAIDQKYGMVTYTQELISLKGKNDLDFQLGIRFDQNDAVTPTNVQDIASFPSAYQVEYTTDWYVVDSKGETLKQKGLIKRSEIYYDSSKHNDYYGRTSIVEDHNTFAYVFIVTSAEIHTKDAGTLTESNNTNTPSHNQKLFNLGDGWAFTVPSVEIYTDTYTDGKQNIVHFADGQKYTLNYNNGKYSLVGYDFKDIQFLDANPNEFQSDGKIAKWVISYKDGKCDYFSNEGLYLGSSDLRGTAASSFIYA